jgi:hypothetical protein
MKTFLFAVLAFFLSASVLAGHHEEEEKRKATVIGACYFGRRDS